MDYWPSARWKIGLLTGGVQRWVEPPGPLALIGAHPCCAARVDEKRVPPVAYIACSFEDSVEVWPVRPLAFDRWGVIGPNQELIVGQTHVTLVHQTHASWPRVSGGQQSLPSGRNQAPTGLLAEPLPQLLLEWSGKVRPKPLYRRVTIIGQDHPSTLRMYGLSMQRCDHAIIAVDGWLGLVNLAPGMVASTDNLVTRLTPDSPPITIGRVSVSVAEEKATTPSAPIRSLASAQSDLPEPHPAVETRDVNTPETDSQEVTGSSGTTDSPGTKEADSAGTSTQDHSAASEPPASPPQAQPAVTPQAHPAASTASKPASIPKESSSVTRAAVENSPVGSSPAPQPPPAQTPVTQTLASKPSPTTNPPPERAGAVPVLDGHASSSGQRPRADRPSAPAPVPKVAEPAQASLAVREDPQDRAGPDALSSQLTDRLIAKDQDRFMHRRILIQSAYTAAFLVAGILLAWVIIAKVLPLVGS